MVTGKQLHRKTKVVLSQLEQGESLVITRNDRAIAKIEPVSAAVEPEWAEIMADVWQAQKTVKPRERLPNPVLLERQRRRR